MTVGDLLPATAITRAAIRARVEGLEILLSRFVKTFGDIMEAVNEMREQLADEEPAKSEATSQSLI